MKQTIFLVGLMGSGKTTIGRKLAHLLGREFVDTDQELIRRTGVSISHIFEVEGEQGFRDRESRLLAELCERNGVVVATGGGIVNRQQNRELLKAHGIVVYLDVEFPVLWNRLKDCQHRPLLQVENPRQKVEELAAERSPHYSAIADLHIAISSDSAVRTAKRIHSKLNAQYLDTEPGVTAAS